MNKHPAGALLVGLAFATFAASAPGLIALQWSADNTFFRELAVPAGTFVEACGKLPARAEVEWSFEAGRPLDFNIHFHEGERVHYPARQNQVASASGKLVAKVEQDYCWMWTNKGSSEAALRVRLARR
jgi:hypothetical protein